MSLLDNLPKLPFLSSKKEDNENFFALNIDFDKVTAAVWTVYDNRLHILNTAVAPYSDGASLEFAEVSADKSEESAGEAAQKVNSLIEAANLSLDEALADTIPEPTKLLFGVPDSWLEEENIKPEYLKILKRMVKELGVEPMAYVSATHAIAHILQKQHGIPLSAILVNLSKPLVITVIKGGKTMATKIQTRGKNLGDSIEKGLSQLSEVEVFPSRLLLFGSDEEGIKDELSSRPWTEQLPFLHLPRIEQLPAEVAIQAVGFAGASEINPNLLPEIVMAMADVPAQVSRKLPIDESEEEVGVAGSINSAGFVEGDINQMRSEKSENPRIRESDEEDSGDKEQGSESYDAETAVDENFLEQEEWVDEPQQRQLSRRYEEEGGLASKLQSLLMLPVELIRRSGGEVATRGAGTGSLLSFLPHKMILIPILFLIALVLLFIFVPKAQVSVFVDMKPLENSTQIIADPAISEINEAGNKIPGKIIETDISGTGEGNASGTKQVGDPAKGKVVVYNATTNNLNLSSGTVLTTGDGKKFTLNSAVQVASKSASAADPPSRSDVVDSTAQAIGPDGNIAAGTDLSVAGLNKADVVAKVDTAFSGGVSKDVQVVTVADQQKLLSQVTSDLKTKAQVQLQEKLEGDAKILQESFSETIGKKTYSKNVGDEAGKFSLTVNAHYKGTAYSDSDLKALVSKLVQTKIPDPEHYTLDLSQTETQAEVSNVGKDGKLTFNAKFKAKLMPKLDIEKLRSAIVGKSVDDAVQILKDAEQQIIGANVKLSPSLPGPFQRLPLRKENITIEVTAK